MTSTPDELAMVRLCRVRNALCQKVRGLLAGSGLEVREQAKELVISNPKDPQRGRIHVTYSAGEVSWSKTVWDYWGYFQGYGNAPGGPGGEPAVDADRIIATLGGQADQIT